MSKALNNSITNRANLEKEHRDQLNLREEQNQSLREKLSKADQGNKIFEKYTLITKVLDSIEDVEEKFNDLGSLRSNNQKGKTLVRKDIDKKFEKICSHICNLFFALRGDLEAKIAVTIFVGGDEGSVVFARDNNIRNAENYKKIITLVSRYPISHNSDFETILRALPGQMYFWSNDLFGIDDYKDSNFAFLKGRMYFDKPQSRDEWDIPYIGLITVPIFDYTQKEKPISDRSILGHLTIDSDKIDNFSFPQVRLCQVLAHRLSKSIHNLQTQIINNKEDGRIKN